MANDFPTPNSHVDDLMHLLTGDEYKVLAFMVRHILGWQDRRESRTACISLTMLCEGYTARSGTVFHGTGLSRPTVTKCLAALVDYGLIDPVGAPTPEGQVWFLPARALISDTLLERQTAARAKAQQRMAHARGKRGLPVNGVNQQVVNGIRGVPGKQHLLNQTNSQTNRQTHAVVVGPDHDTGELVVNSEGLQPKLDTLREGAEAVQAALAPIPRSEGPLTPTAEALIRSLASLNVSRKLAEKLLVDYGEARVQAVWRHMQDAKNPLGVGFLRSELANPFYVPLDHEQGGTLPAFLHNTIADDIDLDAQRLADLEAREHIAAPAPIDGRAVDTWKTVHHQMSLMFDPVSFSMWLKSAQLLSYDAGTYTIGVPTAQAQDMLQHRYYRKIQRVFEGLHKGEGTVSIVFQVWAAPALDQTPLSDTERDELAGRRAGTWIHDDRGMRLLAPIKG